MSTVTVQDTVLDAAGNPVPNASVRITLVTSASGQPGYTAGGTVISSTKTIADSAGKWSTGLVPNSQITPANTYYNVYEGNAQPTAIVVPATGGPYNLKDILATPPPTPASPGISASLVQAKGDLLVATGPGAVAHEAVGADGLVLTADSTQPTGIGWKPPSGGMTYRGAWAANTIYAVNDAFTYAGSTFIVTTAFTSGTRFSLANLVVLYKPPYRFDVTHYGAQGDGKVVTDGVIAAGSAVLTSQTAAWTAADQGKPIMVVKANDSALTTLVTTISTVNSPTQVTLAAAAVTAVTSGGWVLWATDDTAAVQAAADAADAYAGVHGYGEAYAPAAPNGLYYGIAGPLRTDRLGNSQLCLSAPDPKANKKVVAFKGCGDQSVMFHWQQLIPQLSGSTLVSFALNASINAQATLVQTKGNPSVIGGPNQANGYGTNALVFSNMLVVLDGISIVTPYSNNGLNYCGADFSGVAQANVLDCSFGVTAGYADLQNPNPLSAGQSIALLMPANGNNDSCVLRNVSIMGGYTHGVYATEHTVATAPRILYCWGAIGLIGSYLGSVGASHAVNMDQVSIEGCKRHVNVIGSGQSGVGPTINISQMDTEGIPIIYDGSNNGAGGFALGDISVTGYSPPQVPNPTGIRVRNVIQQPGWVAAPSYTLGVPFMNPWWRDATVTLSGGTVTGVRVGRSNAGVAALGGSSAPTMQSVWTGALSAPLTLRIPPGGWLAIDGTVAPNVAVVLD